MIWSTPMWNLYHTMCEKCDDDSEKRKKLYELMQYLSYAIPCGMCKVHASSYLHKNKKNSVVLSKKNFKMFFYTFHNSVKETRKLKLESTDVLDKYKTMNLNDIYIDVIKMLVLFGMKDNYTTKINSLYLEIFGTGGEYRGAGEINEAYVKDTNNRQKILDKLGVKTRKINKKDIDGSLDKKIESNKSIDGSLDKKIKSNSINNKSRSVNTKPNILMNSLLLVGGGLLVSRFKKNKK
jgi:hypothetical protein